MRKKTDGEKCALGNAYEQSQDERKVISCFQQKHAIKDDKAEIVQQLTQKQYELSKELADGIERLKKLVQETEKYTCKAKGKYQE